MARNASLLQGLNKVTSTLSLTLSLVDSFLENSHCIFGGLPHHIYHTVILTDFRGAGPPLHLARCLWGSIPTRSNICVQY